MYGTIRTHLEKIPYRIIATSLTNPDFLVIAKQFGCGAELVKDNTSFVPALNRALQNDKLTICNRNSNKPDSVIGGAG